VSESSHSADGIATALLSGPWTAPAMRARITEALGLRRRPEWARPLADQVLAAYRDPPADRPRELAAYLQTLPAWALARQSPHPLRVVHWTPAPTSMRRAAWPVAPLPDLGELCRLLEVDAGELAWFADVRSLERRSGEQLRHYRWTALPKRAGVRLVAAPKPRLKQLQRRLLRHVLAPIPVHPAAHGCVPGHSVRTAVLPHVNATVVLRLDVEAFFASIPAGRLWGVLRTAGLPEQVAHTITGLLTTVVPVTVWRAMPGGGEAHWRLGRRLAAPHLPQGAPTSPAAANLVAFTLDRRLSGLAERFGARYTRYVDDLTFSGGRSLRVARSRFVELAGRIVRDEGFVLNERKSVVLGDSGRQQVLGAVVNDHPALPREERDRLRALLHNCAVHGWRTQARGRENFPEHVRGLVSWANGLDPAFGARLRARYDAIVWT
jgi:hypothetical protein